MFVSPTFSAVAGAWAGSFFAMAKDPEATEMAAKKNQSALATLHLHGLHFHSLKYPIPVSMGSTRQLCMY